MAWAGATACPMLIEIFGDDAPLRARERADEHLEKDGRERRKFWNAVSDAGAAAAVDPNRTSERLIYNHSDSCVHIQN